MSSRKFNRLQWINKQVMKTDSCTVVTLQRVTVLKFFPSRHMLKLDCFFSFYFDFAILFSNMITKILGSGKAMTQCLHPRATSRGRLPFHQLRDLSGFHKPPPLLHHSARVRTYHAAPLILQTQVRAISIWTIPKIALRSIRVPAIIAGTAVTGTTIATNKLQGKKKMEGLWTTSSLITIV